MRRTLARIALFASIFLIVAFVVFLVNQTTEVVTLAERVHPVLGRGVLWGLVGIYAVCIVVPAVMLFRLPRALTPPEREGTPEFDAYLERLGRRLERNPRLAGRPTRSREEIEAALETLDVEADETIRRTGSQIFMMTAISQNGSLDALLVLGYQVRMVWRVARIYYQRPTLRELVHLYANVAATAFVAGELDDVDISEHLQPVVAGALGAAPGAIPGLAGASSLLVNSAFDGATNAFLTLRVGVIARRYCDALVKPDRRLVRRSALAAATGILGSIVYRGTRRLTVAFAKASGRGVGTAVKGVGSTVVGTGSAVADSVRGAGESMVTRVADAGRSVAEGLGLRRREGRGEEEAADAPPKGEAPGGEVPGGGGAGEGGTPGPGGGAGSRPAEGGA